jgi:hypothetical protein
MSRLVLEKELSLIRQRLEAIEDALGEEMTVKDKAALEEALREHRKGRASPSGPEGLGPASLESIPIAQSCKSSRRNDF